MTTLSRRAELRRQVRESVGLIGQASTPAERETALACLRIDSTEAQCEGVSVPELRQLVGTYWPSITAGRR